MTNKIIAKIDNVNLGAHFCNMSVIDVNDNSINIKLDPEELEKLEVGKVYVFEYLTTVQEPRDLHTLTKASPVEDVLEDEELNEVLSKLYEYAPIDRSEIKKRIEVYLNKIENETIKLITDELYKKYYNKFYVHPAATKFHHAYVGGLAYHTLTMLDIASPMLDVYTYLNKDLVYSGILIHDMAKIDEMTGVDGEYTKEGQLIGHLVMISMEIDKIAIKHNVENTEEVLLLKHIVLAHHGVLHFGSPKKPQIGEALLIWYIDTIDSKFATLGDVYEETLEGQFTQSVPVLDRMRFYKSTIKNKK